MSDNEKTANTQSMRTRGGGGGAANLKELKRSQSAQEGGSSPNANVVGKKRIEVFLSLFYLKMFQKRSHSRCAWNWWSWWRRTMPSLPARTTKRRTPLGSPSTMHAPSSSIPGLWYSIQTHFGTFLPHFQGQDWNYLRRSKWPNIKRDAMVSSHNFFN